MKIYLYKKCGVFETYKKVSDFWYAEGLHGKHGAQMFSAFGYVYLADETILARKYGFFKAAAVGAIALVLNDMEQLVAFVAFSHAGNDIYHKLCVLEPCIPNDDGIYILNILGDDQRQLAYIEDDLRDLLNVVSLAKSVTVLTIERTTPISCIAAAYFLAIFLVTSFATAAGALPAAPQPRQREVSIFICSSVKVPRRSLKVFFASLAEPSAACCLGAVSKPATEMPAVAVFIAL